jgi:neuronal guanine nucleotide exchange factor
MKFSEILSQLESSPVCQSLSLHSFLMLPMQRITRLPLLVDAVLTRLDPQDDEYNTCRLALATLNKVSLLKVILPCILDLMFCTVTYKSR